MKRIQRDVNRREARPDRTPTFPVVVGRSGQLVEMEPTAASHRYAAREVRANVWGLGVKPSEWKAGIYALVAGFAGDTGSTGCRQHMGPVGRLVRIAVPETTMAALSCVVGHLSRFSICSMTI